VSLQHKILKLYLMLNADTKHLEMSSHAGARAHTHTHTHTQRLKARYLAYLCLYGYSLDQVE